MSSHTDASPAASRVLVARAERVMATEVSVQIAAAPEQEADAHAAAEQCMDFLREVDERLSRFKPESELSRLNRAAGEWFAASEMLFDVVALALHAARSSGGLFDPTLLPQLEALGYDRDFAAIAHREITREDAPRLAWTPGCWREVELDPAGRRMRLPASAAGDVRLDLGGIAKGWAADVALERFCAPFPGALVNVSGDLRVRGGPQPGVAWSVGIRDPRDEALDPIADDAGCDAAVITFSRGGLATSGAGYRWWLRDGVRQHHLLDPRTGRPIPLWMGDTEDSQGEGARLIASATALAPTAAQAEVAAKVALLRGYPAALRIVERAWQRYGARGFETSVDASVALFLTFGTGETALSRNMHAYLATWGTEGALLPLRIASPHPDENKDDAAW